EVMIAKGADDVEEDPPETGFSENGLHVCCVLLNCLQRLVPLCTSTKQERYYGKAPSTKLQATGKLQIPSSKIVPFGYSSLELLWSLEFCAWRLTDRLTHAEH